MRNHLPLLTLLIGCNRCQPGGLPSNNNQLDTGPTDTSQPTDTSPLDDSGPTDTGPPPPCAHPEVEPHTIVTPESIEMETWVCGTFGESTDVDIFTVKAPAGWVRIQSVAASLGSNADTQVISTDDDNDYTLYQEGSYGSTDAVATFRLPDSRDVLVQLRDSYAGYGDDYTWQMMVSEVKEPVPWTVEEVESNNTSGAAQALTTGDAVYATISRASDVDWYSFAVPAGRVDLALRIDAYRYGSAADTEFTLYDQTGAKYQRVVNAPGDGFDYDPKLDASVEGEGVWTLEVKFQDGVGNPAQGSDAIWYVLGLQIASSADTAGR